MPDMCCYNSHVTTSHAVKPIFVLQRNLF